MRSYRGSVFETQRAPASTAIVTLVSVATGVAAGIAAGSATIGVFWAVLTGYALKTVLGLQPDDWGGSALPGAGRRVAVVAVSAAAAVGVLALDAGSWGRAWIAPAVALTAGTLVHIGAWWIAAPPPARVKALNDLRNPRIEVHPGDVSPGTVAFVGAAGALTAFAGMAVLDGELMDGLLTLAAVVSVASAAVGLWARGKVHRR